MQLRDHPFNTYTKFAEKLTSLNPLIRIHLNIKKTKNTLAMLLDAFSVDFKRR